MRASFQINKATKEGRAQTIFIIIIIIIIIKTIIIVNVGKIN